MIRGRRIMRSWLRRLMVMARGMGLGRWIRMLWILGDGNDNSGGCMDNVSILTVRSFLLRAMLAGNVPQRQAPLRPDSHPHNIIPS